MMKYLPRPSVIRAVAMAGAAALLLSGCYYHGDGYYGGPGPRYHGKGWHDGGHHHWRGHGKRGRGWH